MRAFDQHAQEPESAGLAQSHTTPPGTAQRMHPIRVLQRALGNHALQRLLQTEAEAPQAGLAAPALARFSPAAYPFPLHRPAVGVLQTQGALSTPDDEYEQEAERVSAAIMHPPEPRLQRVQAQVTQAAPGEVPPSVYRVMRAPGQPLDAATRAFMEPRFGYDFSEVRVHTDAPAAESARAVHALAYTVGRNVVFGAGQYAPGTSTGRRLLAHELTHVVQQGAVQPQLQRKPDPQPKKTGVQFSFSVSINKVLNGDQLLIELIKQYRNVTTDAQAEALRSKENWHWQGTPPTVKESDVAKGYILVPINDLSITPGTAAERKDRAEYFKGLAQGQQDAINDEVDRQFWKKTKYRVGQLLGDTADDKKMAEYWKLLRDELIRKRQAIDALPLAIQAFLFDEQASATLAPADFEAVLRIASKVAGLTPAELAEYKSRVNAQTSDWSAYEASIDRFLAERKEREATAAERRTIETRFYNLETLYDRYRSYLSMLKNNARLAGLGASNPRAAGAAMGSQPTINKMRAELEADLIKAGFPGGISEFAKLIDDYERVFERETIAIARVMLDQYEHLLWTQERQYRNAPGAEALYTAVSGTKARADYEEAEKIRSEHATGVVLSPDEMAEQAYWVGQRNQALARGESKVRSVAGAHPLVGNRDFDREGLARASSKDDVQSLMLAYIAARRKDIAETRQNLKDKPRMIYGLKDLLNASFQSQNIQKGTIYEKIIRDHISDVHWDEAIPNLILAVIAIGAGLLTGGGGTVAVLAAGTALGIGAYQALDEFRRYEMKSAAYGAQLTSDDPTMAWVIVAVIGAGFDAAAFVSVLPKLRPAIQAFNAGTEAGDVVKLAEKLDKLTDVEESIRKSIIRAAEAEAEARAAWKAVFRPPAMLRMVIIPGAEEFGRLVYAVYLTIRRGIREFQVFVKTNEAIELIGDVTKLTAEELTALKGGYLKAIEEMEAVAAHGKALGMADNEIRAFMNMRGNTKGMTVDQLVKEMDAWNAARGSGLPFGFQNAEQFEKFRSTASAELSKLLKRTDPKAEAFLQGSSVSGISYKRHLPFDAASDFDVAISSRYLTKQAEKLGYEVKLSPRRVGPLDADQVAELGLGKLEKRLGEVLAEEASAAGGTTAGASRKINFMLFETEDAVRKPIGAAATETERATLPLKGGK